MLINRWMRCLGVLGITVLFCGMAWGQAVNNATVHGIVKDPSGAAVPGAHIKATQLDTGHVQETVSGGAGEYTLPGLPIGGAYSLEVTSTGFSPYKQTGIVLTVGSNVEVEVAMGVGGVSQAVQVDADATMIQTQDTSISETIDSKRIVDLPLNGRQATDLIALTGGAASPPNAASRVVSSHDYVSSLGVSIMGGQINGNNYILDGGDHNDSHSNINLPFPFPDALQEFTVQSSGVSARFGLHPGSVINAVTKSGTNQFHGTVFEFIRNGAVNAKGRFPALVAGVPQKDPLKRNQYGGDIGGPVLHNKVFFFGGAQETAIRTSAAGAQSLVPTAAMLAGDFSKCSKITSLKDPTTGVVIPSKQINPNRFVVPALNVAKLLPTSTDPCGAVTPPAPNPSNEIQAVGKVDININSHHTVLARYFMLDYSNPAVYVPGNILTLARPTLAQRAQSITLGEQYVVNSNLVNGLHFTYSRLAVNRTNPAALQGSAQLGVQGIYNIVPNFTYISVSGAFNYGGNSNSPASFIRNQWQWSDDVDYIYKKNHFSLGFENIIGQMDQTNIQNENGAFTFDGSATNYAIADFLTGSLKTLAVNNLVVNGLRQKYIGAYIQDDIQFSPRVTFHAGVRWEPSLPEYDARNEGNHIDIPSLIANKKSVVFNNAPAGMFFVGDGNTPRAFAFGNYANLAPRVGIAIDPDGKGRQSIRSSFGIFFDQPESYTDSAFGIGSPWANGLSLTNPVGGFLNPFQGYPGGDPFPLPFPTANAPFALAGTYVNLPLNLHHPYMEAWNLSYQRQAGRDWVFDVDYVGNRAVHFRGATEANPAIYAPGVTTATTQARRYFNTLNPTAGPYYSTVTQMDDHINTYYEGLRVSAQHRLAQHYTLLAVYTYSHCLQSAETLGNKLQGNTESNPNYREQDFGNCDFDLRHNFVSSFVYDGYHFKNNRLLDTILGGWSPAFLVSRYSAYPFSVTAGTDVSLTGVGLDRATIVPGVNPYAKSTTGGGTPTWINAAAFTKVPGSFGNSRMNSLYGPAYIDVDTTLVKNIRTFREQQLQLRFETFNLFNHTNLAAPIAAQNNTTQFGSITSQIGNQRILQGAIKYTF